MSALILAGLLLLAVTAVVGTVPRARSWCYLPAGVGCGLLASVGALALTHPVHPPHLGFGSWLGSSAALVLDPLSGLFWLITFAVAVPAMLTATGWHPVRRPGPTTAAASALILASVACVEAADNAFVFLFAWELLTLGFYLLVGAERRRVDASLITVAFGKLSGAALLIGLLLPAAQLDTLHLPDYTHLAPGAAHTATWILLVIGFAIKVGLAPVQIWLPGGYAAAPAGLRPLMAGVAVNAGFYGLWRTLNLLGPPPAALALTLLIIAAITALLGIAHAAVQGRLERVIAYSSIENAGLICTGYAVALIGTLRHDQTLTAVGLLAATLQTITHAVAKTLLFATCAALETDAETGELEHLRGTARTMPWAATGLAVGCITLAGLPPTAGFVSEWFLLESLMQNFRLPHLPYALLVAAAGAAVALTAGFASVTFVRIVGMTVLGPRNPAPQARKPHRIDLGLTGRAGVTVLAVACLALAAVTPLEIRTLARGLAPLIPASSTQGALKSPWIVQPVYAKFSILAPTWLWIIMPTLAAGVLTVLLTAASRGRSWRVRRVPAWRSASGGVQGSDQYTAFGYANPTRRVLGALLQTRTRTTTHPTPDTAAASESTTGHEVAAFPAPQPAVTGGVLGYTSDVVEVVETYLYQPLRRPLAAAVTAAKRLQSGRLDAYLAYMLITLVALIAIVTALT